MIKLERHLEISFGKHSPLFNIRKKDSVVSLRVDMSQYPFFINLRTSREKFVQLIKHLRLKDLASIMYSSSCLI